LRSETMSTPRFIAWLQWAFKMLFGTWYAWKLTLSTLIPISNLSSSILGIKEAQP
jgi:hypothetical protein